MSAQCNLCPVRCGAERDAAPGRCGEKNEMRMVKYGLHPYEEPCISFRKGSGTVFFSGCALKCVFCQNFDLSRSRSGEEVSPQRLADIFRELEEMGAENINLVTASHFLPKLLQTFSLYRPKIPVVYNTHAYEDVRALRALDPYIDIWLPDLKYFSPRVSERYTGRADYFAFASRAVEFMAQRRPIFQKGKMLSGCIVRHLILPLNSGDSVQIVKWFAALHSPAFLSVMGQYIPCGEIANFPELQRKITPREYRRVVDCALAEGIENLFVQELSSAEKDFIPDFSPSSPDLF